MGIDCSGNKSTSQEKEEEERKRRDNVKPLCCSRSGSVGAGKEKKIMLKNLLVCKEGTNVKKNNPSGSFTSLTPLLLTLLFLSLNPSPSTCRPGSKGSPKLTLHAAGFFPVSPKIPEGSIGRGVIPAVELALQHINESPKILRGIHLDLEWNDTEVRVHCLLLQSRLPNPTRKTTASFSVSDNIHRYRHRAHRHCMYVRVLFITEKRGKRIFREKTGIKEGLS